MSIQAVDTMFSELFSNNLLVKLLRGDNSRYDLIVSMVGVKLGERLLQVGGGDGALLAAIGGKAGLTGTIAAVEPDDSRAAQVRNAVEKGGVLADVYTSAGPLPFDPGSFDIVVIPFPADEGAGLAATMDEAFRVLRDGGRVLIVTRGGGRGQPGAGSEGAAAHGTEPPIVATFQRQGFRAARLLAERNGLTFYEGVKK